MEANVPARAEPQVHLRLIYIYITKVYKYINMSKQTYRSGYVMARGGAVLLLLFLVCCTVRQNRSRVATAGLSFQLHAT